MLFTGGAEDDELAAAYELEVRSYLEKTAGPAEIIEAIRLTLAGEEHCRLQ